MSNKPLIKVKGKIQDLEKTIKNIKPKQSNFLLTLNTNQQFKEDDPHCNYIKKSRRNECLVLLKHYILKN